MFLSKNSCIINHFYYMYKYLYIVNKFFENKIKTLENKVQSAL